MLYQTAIRQIQRLLAQAARRGVREPTAVALATTDARGRPSVRTVLLKRVDARGLVFYTNTRSRKGRHLAARPRAGVCCFWEPLKRQIMVEGRVERIAAQEADAYWAGRPRLHQLSAWASLQSQPLPTRLTLARRFALYRRRFAGRAVPRPPHWSGYRLVPERIEFWRARPYRLNERVVYQRAGKRWKVQRLYP
ncbi:MAG: pyridoxamine 5'-phosphate oxidase [Candidatus Omnitrophica bacterium CG11_big_fil_rev_8_21_14_0_20_63_9]|nr:MAG: pyridoxamine 5'-phosphate oxidase [Candidatus Omnitrophica bacterium CG11_big_fil_rev_8_21_14_0_20_63_9]